MDYVINNINDYNIEFKDNKLFLKRKISTNDNYVEINSVKENKFITEKIEILRWTTSGWLLHYECECGEKFSNIHSLKSHLYVYHEAVEIQNLDSSKSCTCTIKRNIK